MIQMRKVDGTSLFMDVDAPCDYIHEGWVRQFLSVLQIEVEMKNYTLPLLQNARKTIG